MSLATTVSSLVVRPWPDSVIDQIGHDPRSSYVERFWLPVIGPSATWFLRRVAGGLDHEPDGFELPIDETALALGLAAKDGRQSPFRRIILRCCQFRLTHVDDVAGELLVRRKLPPLTRNQIARLPESLQAAHQRYAEQQLRRPDDTTLRSRAQRLAFTLFELGEDRAAAEQQLVRWRFHPAIAADVVAWAYDHAGRRGRPSRPSPPPPPDEAA
ncbi:MAG: hypothetical protein ACRD29_18990 [Acidimicrobiales bacterium]